MTEGNGEAIPKATANPTNVALDSAHPPRGPKFHGSHPFLNGGSTLINEMAPYRRIGKCRVGGGTNLVRVLTLGDQVLTGVFPRASNQDVTRGPIELVSSPQSGHLQLAHTYNAKEMYGENYGYRSGLNKSMVDHLTRKVRHLEHIADLKPGDTVLDIGSNDCTSLKAYETPGLKRIGIDPTGSKFRAFYPDDVRLVPDFFSADGYLAAKMAPARLVTSIAMFYDLDDPIDFARQVETVLAADGLWHFEQSYMPSMLRTCSYDTNCHEHLNFFSLSVIKDVLNVADMKLVDVQMNATNGGSLRLRSQEEQRHTLERHGDRVATWPRRSDGTSYCGSLSGV